MKFAVLNADDDTLTLVRSLAADEENRLVFAHGGSKSVLEQLRRAVPSVRIVDSWEEGLVDPELTVIVGRDGSPDLRFEQLRKLAQEGIPTVVVHPFSLQPLEYRLVSPLGENEPILLVGRQRADEDQRVVVGVEYREFHEPTLLFEGSPFASSRRRESDKLFRTTETLLRAMAAAAAAGGNRQSAPSHGAKAPAAAGISTTL